MRLYSLGVAFAPSVFHYDEVVLMKTLGIVVIGLVSVVLQVTVNGKVGLREGITAGAREAYQSNIQPCAREALKITEGETDAAMGGVRRTPYVLTNISKSPCTLKGYPSLELLNKAGAVVRRATKQKLDERTIAATLEP